MSYIEQFEVEFAEKLDSGADTASIERWVSEKVLESYRNGITAGQKGMQVIRKGKMRLTHLYICGAASTGKSKILETLICQDIKKWHENKYGALIIIDPHGSLYDNLINRIA